MDLHKHRRPLKTYSKHLLQDSYKPPEKRQRVDTQNTAVRLTACKATLSTASLSTKRSIADFFKASIQSSSPPIPHSSAFPYKPPRNEANKSCSPSQSHVSSSSPRPSEQRRRRRLNTRPSLKLIKMVGDRSSSGGNGDESRGDGSNSTLSTFSNPTSVSDGEFLTASDSIETSLPAITVTLAASRQPTPSHSTSAPASIAAVGESPADPSFDDDDDDDTLVGNETSDTASVYVTDNYTAALGSGESVIPLGLDNASASNSSNSTIAQAGSFGSTLASTSTSLSDSAPLEPFRTLEREESANTSNTLDAYSEITGVLGLATSVSTGSNPIFGMDLGTSTGADGSAFDNGNGNPNTAADANGDSSVANSAFSLGIISTSSSENREPNVTSTAAAHSVLLTPVPDAATNIANANAGPVISSSSVDTSNVACAANGAAASQNNATTGAISISTGNGQALRLPQAGSQATSSMVQTQLDLGVPTQINCPLCRFTYNRTVAEDCSLHQRHHEAFRLGVPIGNLQLTQGHRVRQLWPPFILLGDYIVVVDATSSKGWKDLAVKVLDTHVDNDLGTMKIAENTLWSMIPDPEMANGGNLTALFKVYLYVKDFGPGAPKRVVSLLLAERITSAVEAHRFQLQADEFGPFPSIVPNIQVEVSDKTQDAKLGVSKLWTHRSQRRRGFATSLLETARSTYIWGYRVSLAHVAWTYPTEAGARLAETYFGELADFSFLHYVGVW